MSVVLPKFRGRSTVYVTTVSRAVYTLTKCFSHPQSTQFFLRERKQQIIHMCMTEVVMETTILY